MQLLANVNGYRPVAFVREIAFLAVYGWNGEKARSWKHKYTLLSGTRKIDRTALRIAIVIGSTTWGRPRRQYSFKSAFCFLDSPSIMTLMPCQGCAACEGLLAISAGAYVWSLA
jgi:hypothetical protein